MSGVDLIVAFQRGRHGRRFDRFVPCSSPTPGSTERTGMGSEPGDDGPERRTRADVYSTARIGAAAALTLVVPAHAP
jgi:hypothetical protein